jgi:hypothetical protein
VGNKGLKAFTPYSFTPHSSQEFLGGYAEGVTPVPIPNTEVKPLRADGTAWVAVWESRSPPGSFTKTPCLKFEMGRFCVRRTVLVNFPH